MLLLRVESGELETIYSLFRNAFVWNWGENVFAISWKLGLSLNKSSDRLSWNSGIIN